ncbi:histone-arginine methyltransferase METTL23-like isoform X2 [Sycon ciliatum]|uniref:histone-arginine methyltransferase METTL23-like isoform X2 n=1 Tax=Sycon ciliatum TaxID=27933 RepID=UPI0031F6F94F
MAAVRRTEKVFEFEEFGLPPLKVIVPEVLDSDYGMYTWPSAPVLARYVWKQQHDVRGKRVLELGSGTSLAGITAALVGAGGVVLSEREGNPQLLDNCRRTCTANNVPHRVVNGGESVRFPEDVSTITTVTMATASAANTSTDRCHGDVQVIGLDWACFCPSLVTLPPVDIILGADCFYDQKDYENIIVTVSFLLERNPSCRFWTTYQERVCRICGSQSCPMVNLCCTGLAERVTHYAVSVGQKVHCGIRAGRFLHFLREAECRVVRCGRGRRP